MFDDVSEAQNALELAQDAANRHRVPFYIVSHPVMSGRVFLRISSSPPGDYLERVMPTGIPLA